MCMTLPTSRQQRLILAKPLNPQDPSLKAHTPSSLRLDLRRLGCDGCELGCQPNFVAPVVGKGNAHSKVMLVGEAPGMHEDREGVPFTGPAGRVLDEMFAEVGLDTNTDLYITNTVKCRPVAPEGSGKQNLAPSQAHRDACRPYLDQEINYIQPHTVGLLGGVAAKSVLGLDKYVKVSNIVGRLFLLEEYPFVQFFVFYHPAYILRVRNDPAKKEKVWPTVQQHVKDFVQLIKDMEKVGYIND